MDLSYLDFGGALRSGFNLGLQVQAARDRRRLEQQVQANRVIDLELRRKQEQRQQEELQESIRARRMMAMERAQEQMESVAFVSEVNNLVQQGKTPLEANAEALRKYPRANQARNSILPLLEKTKTTPDIQSSPQDIELKWNAQGVPFYRNAKGELEIPPNSEGLRKTYLEDQADVKRKEREIQRLEALKEQGKTKTKLFGGRPIQEAIDEAQAKIDETMAKYQPRRPEVPPEHQATRGRLLEQEREIELPSDTPKPSATPEHQATRGRLLERERDPLPEPSGPPEPSSPKAQKQFKVGQKVRRKSDGKVFIWDGKAWNPE